MAFSITGFRMMADELSLNLVWQVTVCHFRVRSFSPEEVTESGSGHSNLWRKSNWLHHMLRELRTVAGLPYRGHKGSEMLKNYLTSNWEAEYYHNL